MWFEQEKYAVLTASKKKYIDLIQTQKYTLTMSVNIQDVVKNLEAELEDFVKTTNGPDASDTNKLAKHSAIPDDDDEQFDEEKILKLKYM